MLPIPKDWEEKLEHVHLDNMHLTLQTNKQTNNDGLNKLLNSWPGSKVMFSRIYRTLGVWELCKSL